MYSRYRYKSYVFWQLWTSHIISFYILFAQQIAGFNGLSDAIKRLDFVNAVHDNRRFGYICKLLEELLSRRLASLSGCARRVLLATLEEVACEGTSGQNWCWAAYSKLVVNCIYDLLQLSATVYNFFVNVIWSGNNLWLTSGPFTIIMVGHHAPLFDQIFIFIILYIQDYCAMS
jgi:hypothetical protein